MLNTNNYSFQITHYPRIPYSPWSPSTSRNDRILSVDKMENFLGKRVILTEKIDGSNTLLHNGHAYSGRTSKPSRHKIHGMAQKYHAWKIDDLHQLYGEDIYALHSIAYNAIYLDETFYAFDLRVGDEFLSWDELIDYTKELSIPTVPVLFDGVFSSMTELSKWMDACFTIGSKLGPTIEGAVLRIANKRPLHNLLPNVCKIVRPNHVQTDQHWSRNWTTCALKATVVNVEG